MLGFKWPNLKTTCTSKLRKYERIWFETEIRLSKMAKEYNFITQTTI